MSKRITWIDVARGMAMIAIVFGHTVNMGPWKVWVYSFHVPLFFILSGMTFHVEAAFGRFCIDKARRLLVPYFCFGFASILAFFVAGNFAASILGRGAVNTSLGMYLIGLAYGNGKNGMMDFNLPLWFLPCMFVVYLFAFFLVWIEKRSKRAGGIKALIMLATLLISIAITQIDPVPALPFSAENALVLLPFFYFGVVLRCVDWPVLRRYGKVFVGVAMFAIGLIAAMLNARNGIVDYVATACRSYPLFLIGAVFQCSGLMLILSTIRTTNALSSIGRQTMPVLVMHKFPVVLCQIILANVVVFGAAALANPLVALFVSLLAIGACLEAGSLLNRFAPWVFGLKRQGQTSRRGMMKKGSGE